MFISGQALIEIIRRTLNKIDYRLVEHGKRVSLIMYYILRCTQSLDSPQRSRLYLLGLLHDIGAYKTNEITRMLSFDAVGSWEHSVYGYLFLKKITTLDEDALPLLYHHLPFKMYSSATPPLQEEDFAGLIFLADRVDLILNNQGAAFCKQWLVQNRGVLFSPYWVDLFMLAEEQFHIFNLMGGKEEAAGWEAIIEEFSGDGQDFSDYLPLIAYVIDFRSEQTVLHTVNTVSISDVIGKRLGISPEEADALHYGALLHDIGKVACPVEILEKPGSLTPEEMLIMKQHVEITREILSGLIDPTVVEIACRHHERLDGSGYPQQLAYAALSLPQRIAAVADVVSALIRKRSYKSAFSKETTLRILSDLKELNQFCCMSIDSVLDNFDEIIQTSDAHDAVIIEAYESIHREYSVLLEQLPTISVD